MRIILTSFLAALLVFISYSCKEEVPAKITKVPAEDIRLDLSQAERLFALPLSCIQEPFPYKSGVTIAKEEDLQLPQIHHPAFYGCFDWHSAVHGHWSLIYLLKSFPQLKDKNVALTMLDQNLTAEHIAVELDYFTMNKSSASFERTYGWAWLLKLQEELYTWEDERAAQWYKNISPLADYISKAYIDYLPKLVYPIRVGEHSNTAFGLSMAHDYALAVGDEGLLASIEEAALRFYSSDTGCPISWEPSGYDFLSPCLQELDIMRKVLSTDAFDKWSKAFLPELFDGTLDLEPAIIKDRSDGKLVHLDGLNFSRAWCLYSMSNEPYAQALADEHLAFSLDNITDGDYAGQHWLGSFALYALKAKGAGNQR